MSSTLQVTVSPFSSAYNWARRATYSWQLSPPSISSPRVLNSPTKSRVFQLSTNFRTISPGSAAAMAMPGRLGMGVWCFAGGAGSPPPLPEWGGGATARLFVGLSDT